MSRLNHLITLILFLCILLVAAAWAEPGKNSDSNDQQAEAENIRTTLHQYAIFLDDGRVDDFIDLFTADAHFTAAGFDYKGREVIRRELADKKRRPGKHLPFPAIIEFEAGNRARAWSDFLRVKITREGDPSDWQITSIGRYYDLLEKGVDGRWRFLRRDVFLPGMKNRDDLVEPSSSK